MLLLLYSFLLVDSRYASATGLRQVSCAVTASCGIGVVLQKLYYCSFHSHSPMRQLSDTTGQIRHRTSGFTILKRY